MKRFLQTILKEIMKKIIILGTSDPWSTSHLFQQTSVLYCRLSDFWAHLYTMTLGTVVGGVEGAIWQGSSHLGGKR